MEQNNEVSAERIDPPHYKDGFPRKAIECIEVVWSLPFCLGNAIKYVWRAGKKPETPWREDLAKARWYLNRWLAKRGKTPPFRCGKAIDRLLETDLLALDAAENARLECLVAILSGDWKDTAMIDAFESALLEAGK